MALTCMFVVRMCFLALLTASLLQEESSTLHHEEALTQAARQMGQRRLNALKHRRYTSDGSAQLCQLVRWAARLKSGTEDKLNIQFEQDSWVQQTQPRDEHKSCLSAGDLPQQLSGKARLPLERQTSGLLCSSYESSECLSVFFLLHGLHLDLTCQVPAGLF